MKFIRGIAFAIAIFSAWSSVFVPTRSLASVEWVKSLAEPEVAVVLSNVRVVRADDGSLFVHGATPQSGGVSRLVVSKLSSTGSLLWRVLVPGQAISQSQSALVLYGASDVVTLTRDLGSDNALITRLDAQGRMVWSRSLPYAGNQAFLFGRNTDLFAVTEWQLARIQSSGDTAWTRGVNSPLSSGERRTGLVLSNADAILQTAYGVNRFSFATGEPQSLSSVTGAQDVVQTLDGNIVFVQSFQYISSTATIVYRLRSVSPAGATQWTQQYAVPTSVAPKVRLFPAPTGGVYVTHVRDLQPYGDVALIDNSGAIQWNRNYFRFYEFVQRSGVLHGLRYDADSNEGINGFFPVQPSNGDLGTPGFSTTTNPPHRFDQWTPTTGGFAAISNTGVTQRIVEVATSGAFLWALETAKVADETAVDRTSCLLPRLVLSSPTRVSTFTRTGIAPNQQTFLGTTSGDGSSHVSSSIDTGHCATAFDNAGGTFRATPAGIRRADESGATTWSVATTSANLPEINRLLLTAANGDAIVAGSDKLSRVSSSGTLLWEVDYNPSNPSTYFFSPKYLFEDANGNAIVAGDVNGDPWAIRVSSAGALLYRQTLGSPACSDFEPRFQAVSTGELYVASTACSEGRVYKYAASGSLIWQRTISASAPDVVAMLKHLVVSSSGDVYVGGCVFSGYGSELIGTKTLLQSYTSSGNERWGQTIDVLLDAKECVASLASDSTRLLVAVESNRATRANYLLAVDLATGVETWRSADVLSNPSVVASDMRAAEPGRLLVFGDNDRSRKSPQIASLRKVDVSIVSTIKTAFVSLPTPSAVFRTPFTVILGLQTTAGATHTVTQPTQIWLSLGSGSGTLSGPHSCTVAAGQSSCVVSGLTYDRAETGVSLAAEIDGSAPTTSALFDVAFAPTQTTIEVLNAPPFYAYDRVQVRYSVTGVAPMLGQEGYLNRSPYPSSCVTLPPLAGFVLREECSVRLAVGTQLSANFYSYTGYGPSTASPIALSVSPVALTIEAASVPTPRVIVGTQFLLTTRIFGARGENLANENDIFLSASDANGNYVCNFSQGTPALRSCNLTANVTGLRTYSISVQNTPNIVPPSPASVSVDVIAGLSITGSLSTNGNSNARMCASSPNADCDVSVELNRYFCALPIGWTGTIYPQVDDLTARATPNAISVLGEAGSVVRDVYFSTGATCSFDIDANGAIETFTDGLFALRAMLGMPGTANEASSASACARRTGSDRTTFANGQIASLKYDIDGDGAVLAATDGVLLMRTLLGFRGDSVTSGAVGNGASRPSWEAIRAYLAGSCGVTAPQ
jgi:hypothetical protein